MPNAKTRIGLLGGTFDPPHLGHLAAARAAQQQLGLDEVRLVVANDPWQKSDSREISAAGTRLKMTQELVKNMSGLVADDCEILRGGKTFTADTVEEMHAKFPNSQIFLIVGADTAARIHTWNRPEIVLALSTLVVVNRGSSTVNLPEIPHARVEHVHMEPVNISSSELRDKVRSGVSIAEFTNNAISQVIVDEHLYTVAS